jgi:putative ABC transport system permease protein
MIKSYFVIAWRQIVKNKLYAFINILGLVVGLSIYVFGSLLVSYERSHDQFYQNFDRIFTAGSIFSASSNVGMGEHDGAYTAFTPFIDAEIEEVEAIARTVGREFLVSIEDNHYYRRIRFVDPAFLEIFDFQYLEGDDRALQDPAGVLLTASSAQTLFGEGNALGKVLALDHNLSLHVAAVIKDLPRNTHFVSTLNDDNGFSIIAPLAALNNATGYDLAGNFSNLSSGDFTYMLLPEGTTGEWLQARLDGVFDRHFPEQGKEVVTGLKVRPLTELNTAIWDQVGLPILDSVRLLAFLVLVIAIVNYTNLASAQSLGRSREIGLRKTMGADRLQLVAQFMVESLCVTVIAMLMALAIIEVLVPVYNNVTDRALAIDYASTLPWLLATTMLVGMIGGAYPAYLITRASPIDALRDGGLKGSSGGRFRAVMLGLQFSISIFMLAIVLVMLFQNQKLENSSDIYPREQMITLDRLNVESIQARLDTLRRELLTVPGVQAVAYSSHVPFEQSNSSFRITRNSGDVEASFLISQIQVDENFLDTYNIPLLHGRGLSREIGGDTLKEGVMSANLLINESGALRLGFASASDAIDQVFYDVRSSGEHRAYTIVGVMPDQNFRGFHNEIRPLVFFMNPASLRYGSIKVSGVSMSSAVENIESVWGDLVTDYPIQIGFLNDTFEDTFQIYMSLSVILGGFASVALMLSLVGLFGLAAFMAEARTKEIGVRKVMGANIFQIVRLLIWQFSRPVTWALVIALPLAYFASDVYLEFFADRINLAVVVVVLAGLLAVAISWAIVAIHAVRIAQANPIHALRYE